MTRILSNRVAYELRLLGHRIQRVEPNPTKPEFNIYIFEEDPTVEADAELIIARIRAEKGGRHAT